MRPVTAATATRLVFLAVGVAAACWSVLIPFVQSRAGLDEAGLGLLLLGLGGGSLLAMPLAGALVPRLGCRAVIAGSLALCTAALLPLATLSAPPLLLAVLLVFGAGLGATDVAMNMQAIIVERNSGRAMMSGFHGLYSLGGIAGALAGAAALGQGATPAVTALLAVAVLLALGLAAWPGLLPYGSPRHGPAFAVPRGLVLLLGLLCFIAFGAEGAVLDWGAVFLSTRRALDPAGAGIGYAAFSATMTLGRLTGDRVVSRLGPARTLAGSGVLAALGFAVVTAVPSVPAAVLGFAAVGAGCANIVPVLFTAVGRQTAMPESLALPAVTTLGYAGILAGPALIGFVAQGFGLPAAFAGIAVLLLAVAACAPRFRSS